MNCSNTSLKNSRIQLSGLLPFMFFFAFLFGATRPALATADSVAHYDAQAQAGFFNGAFDQAILAYQRALVVFWNYRDSSRHSHHIERMNMIEGLATALGETGGCSLAAPYLDGYLLTGSERAVARIVRRIIECHQFHNTSPDTAFQQKNIGFFSTWPHQ